MPTIRNRQLLLHKKSHKSTLRFIHVMQQTAMQQTQPNSDSIAITPMTLEIKIVLVSGGLLVGEKDGLVTVATMGEVKIDTPVGQRSM